jgi:hypothetical protein
MLAELLGKFVNPSIEILHLFNPEAFAEKVWRIIRPSKSFDRIAPVARYSVPFLKRLSKAGWMT